MPAIPLEVREERTIARALRIVESRFRDTAHSINTSNAERLFRLRIGALPHEVMEAALLDVRMRLVAVERVSIGDMRSAPVNIHEIARRALLNCTPYVLLAHNHPSGDCSPSIEDRSATEHARHCLALVGVELVDHIIVGRNRSFSFASEVREREAQRLREYDERRARRRKRA